MKCSRPTAHAIGPSKAMPPRWPQAATRRVTTSNSCATGWRRRRGGGHTPPSDEKQLVRDGLERAQVGVGPWDKTPPAPRLPQAVIESTAAKYREALERLTARELVGICAAADRATCAAAARARRGSRQPATGPPASPQRRLGRLQAQQRLALGAAQQQLPALLVEAVHGAQGGEETLLQSAVAQTQCDVADQAAKAQLRVLQGIVGEKPVAPARTRGAGLIGL